MPDQAHPTSCHTSRCWTNLAPHQPNTVFQTASSLVLSEKHVTAQECRSG